MATAFCNANSHHFKKKKKHPMLAMESKTLPCMTRRTAQHTARTAIRQSAFSCHVVAECALPASVRQKTGTLIHVRNEVLARAASLNHTVPRPELGLEKPFASGTCLQFWRLPSPWFELDR